MSVSSCIVAGRPKNIIELLSDVTQNLYFWERYVRGDREEGLVIDHGLHPVHQEGDILRGGQVNGLFVLHTVLTIEENRAIFVF